MHPARLFIVCGLPGAGKSTRALELAERFNASTMNPDVWMARLGIDIWDDDARMRIESIQSDSTMELLRAGASVVIDRGTWMRAERDHLRERAMLTGALVHLELLDPPLEVLWERVSTRTPEEQVWSRAITKTDLEEWSTVIERPTASELAIYDPWPTVRAGAQPGSPAFPYGTWRPQSRPR